MAITGGCAGTRSRTSFGAGLPAHVKFSVHGRLQHRSRWFRPSSSSVNTLFRNRPAFGGSLNSRTRSEDCWPMGFLLGKPTKSPTNDPLFDAVQALEFGAVFLASLLPLFAVVSTWGVSAAIAALYGLRQFSQRPAVRRGRSFLWSRWPTSRWLASDRAADRGAAQLCLIIAGALLVRAIFGGRKAAQSLVVGQALLVVTAGGSFGLPEASRQFADRGRDGYGTTLSFDDRAFADSM